MATEYGGYQQLDDSDQQIRLITIHPATGTDDILTCTLETVALRDANPFYALSYVWGSDTPTAPISLNGQIVHVRKNLWNFIRAIQDQFCHQTDESDSSARQAIRVWADYVCIQQSNINERNLQVSFMGEIFKSANGVYAWLSETDDDATQCIATGVAMRRQNIPWPRVYRLMGDVEFRIRSITNSEYWTRMWIKQEILLARDLWFCYAHGNVHWRDLAFFLRLAHKKYIPVDDDRNLASTKALLSLLEQRGDVSMRAALCDLMEKFAGARCKDPRDRIYALLALIDEDTRACIKVNYSQSLLQILIENYPLWTRDEPLKHTMNESMSLGTRRFDLAQFRESFLRIFSPGEIRAMCGSGGHPQTTQVRATFASDTYVVKSSFPIAAISTSTVEPVRSGFDPSTGTRAHVSRILIKSAGIPVQEVGESGILYCNTVPDEGDMLMFLRDVVLVARIGSQKAGYAGDESLRQISIIGVGEWEPTIASERPRYASLRNSFKHPCSWLAAQSSDAQFCLEGQSGLITCNATAIVRLILSYRASKFWVGEPERHNITDEGHEKGWSPYKFAQTHDIWQPSPHCLFSESTSNAPILKCHGRDCHRCEWTRHTWKNSDLTRST